MQSSTYEGPPIFRVRNQGADRGNTHRDVACLSGRDGGPRITYTYVNGARSEAGLRALWLPCILLMEQGPGWLLLLYGSLSGIRQPSEQTGQDDQRSLDGNPCVPGSGSVLPFVTFTAAVRFGGAFRLGMGDIHH
jgi:hypothetical protein